MASFHYAAQIIKRSAGRSAVAAAAYRSGTRLVDARTGRASDYSKRRGVVHAEILAPDDAPDWIRDRQTLWNAVEAVERRRDAQLAREINLALPLELSPEERLRLVRDYAREAFVSKGMIADIAIHEPVAERGDDPRNVHAHIMLTLRKAGRHGFHRTKTRAWNSDEQLIAWRAGWAEFQNRALAREGHQVRVDHRTLEAQRAEAQARGDHASSARLDRDPEIHVGPRARYAGRKRPAASQERNVRLRQQPRGQGRERSAQRTVRYPEIDRGRRVDWNACIVARNAASVFDRAEHRERQAVRLRQRELRALRTAWLLERKLTLRNGRSSFRGPRAHGTRDAQRRAWERARQRALRRAQRARSLLDVIEVLFGALVQAHGQHRQRHRSLLRGPIPVPYRGRSRSIFLPQP